ncbi:MAG: hypothetical protein AAFN10_10960 [Bacteroidota bacterium]
MEEQIIFEKIEAYRQNQLSPAEKQEVEKLIETDAQWAAILQQHEEMERYLNDPVANALEAGLAQIQSEKQAVLRPFPRWAYISVAAIALVLIGIWGINQLSPKTDYQTLAISQFEPYPTYLRLRGGAINTDSSRLQEALLLYDGVAYEEALTILQTIEDPDLKLKAQFYMGNIYLSEAQVDAAIAAFEAVLAQPEHLFTIQSKWYLALAYLQKPESKDRGLAFLEEVAKTETEFALKAQQLLDKVQ